MGAWTYMYEGRANNGNSIEGMIGPFGSIHSPGMEWIANVQQIESGKCHGDTYPD